MSDEQSVDIKPTKEMIKAIEKAVKKMYPLLESGVSPDVIKVMVKDDLSILPRVARHTCLATAMSMFQETKLRRRRPVDTSSEDERLEVDSIHVGEISDEESNVDSNQVGEKAEKAGDKNPVDKRSGQLLGETTSEMGDKQYECSSTQPTICSQESVVPVKLYKSKYPIKKKAKTASEQEHIKQYDKSTKGADMLELALITADHDEQELFENQDCQPGPVESITVPEVPNKPVKTAASSEEYNRTGYVWEHAEQKEKTYSDTRHVEVVSARSRDKEANVGHNAGRQAREHRRSRSKSHGDRSDTRNPPFCHRESAHREETRTSMRSPDRHRRWQRWSGVRGQYHHESTRGANRGWPRDRYVYQPSAADGRRLHCMLEDFLRSLPEGENTSASRRYN